MIQHSKKESSNEVLQFFNRAEFIDRVANHQQVQFDVRSRKKDDRRGSFSISSLADVKESLEKVQKEMSTGKRHLEDEADFAEWAAFSTSTVRTLSARSSISDSEIDKLGEKHRLRLQELQSGYASLPNVDQLIAADAEVVQQDLDSLVGRLTKAQVKRSTPAVIPTPAGSSALTKALRQHTSEEVRNAKSAEKT